jgi:hypothetical protein
MNQHLTASWLPTGGEKVIVDRAEPAKETLTVHDVDTFQAFQETYAWQGPPGGAHEGDVSGFSHGGAYAVSRRQQGRWASLELVATSSTDPPYESRVKLPALADQIVSVRFAPLDDYVVAAVRNRDGISRGTTQAVYAAPISVTRWGSRRLDDPTRIALANLPYDPDFPVLALPAGNSLLVYVNPAHQLRAASLDGANDALVAPYADAVWNLEARDDLLWRR